jgi:hypothetical protein
LSVVLCPFLLLRPDPNPVSAALAVVIALTAVVVTCRFASRLDLYLVERQ